MPRTKRSAKLDTWNARKKLPQGKTNQEPLSPGHYLGYRRPENGAAGSWFARCRRDGRILQVRLGTADDFQDSNGTDLLTYAQAEAMAKTWFQERTEQAIRVAGGEPAHVGPYTVTDALKAYFEDGKRRGVKGLQRDEQRASAWILPQLGTLEVAKLTRRRLETWLAEMAMAPRRVRTPHPLDPDAPRPKPRNFKVPRTPKVKLVPPAPPATEDEKRARKDSANRVLTTLKAALNHALDRRQVICSGEAWRETKPYRGTTKARVRFLSVEDQVRLVNVCPQDFRRLVKAALYTGGRYGELGRATVQDFDPTGGTLFLIGKGTGEGKPRRVVLTDEGQAFFQELTECRPAGELIFQRDKVTRRKRQTVGAAWGQSDQSRFMAQACEASGMEPLGFHELRHSYASMLVNAGCPLPYVAAQLGHSDTRMVEKHYGHLAPNAMADSIRALMPKQGLTGVAKVEPLKITGSE